MDKAKLDEKIEDINKWIKAKRPDIFSVLAGILFFENGEVNQERVKAFSDNTGYKVVVGKPMGMLGGYIVVDGEKWYFG